MSVHSKKAMEERSVFLRPAGAVDKAACSGLRAELREAYENHRAVVVDLAAVTFVDSWGLGVLVHAQRAGRDANCSLTIRNPSPRVLTVLHRRGLTQLLEVRQISTQDISLS